MVKLKGRRRVRRRKEFFFKMTSYNGGELKINLQVDAV